MPIHFTRVLGSGLQLDSDVARKLDTNRDGNVDETELARASLPDLHVLRGETASDLQAAHDVAALTNGRRAWKAFAKGAVASVVGSAVFTPLIGIPLGILAGAQDAYGVAVNGYAKGAIESGTRALSLIDLQIAQKS